VAYSVKRGQPEAVNRRKTDTRMAKRKGQKDKRTYNDKQNITQTTKDRATDYGSERICIVC